MIYYFFVLLAVVLGQTFLACIVVAIYQRKNPNINFFKGLKVYLVKEVGTFMTIVMFTCLVLFVLPDWMDLSLSREDLLSKAELTKFEAAQAKFRTYAAGYGVFAQWIAFIFYKGGVHAILNFGKSKGVHESPENPLP